MRWGETITLEFVKIYLRHECLWNPEHPGYKLRFEREKAYTEICSEFKESTGKVLSNPEVKLKIKNLRTTYMQQVHKILRKSSPDCIYEPSLVWFQEMDRCLKHVPINRGMASYNNIQETQEADSSCIWMNQNITTDNNEEVNPDPLIAPDEEFDPQDTHFIKQESTPYKKVKKKKNKRSSQEFLPDSNTSQLDHLKEDEFDVYGKYIASQLRKMELPKALQIQLQIQRLVSEARISDIRSD